MNTQFVTALALSGPLLVSSAVAVNRSVIEAEVVEVEPIVRTVTEKIPHQSCWDERVKVVQQGGRHSATPGLLGAVVGGALAGSLGHNSHHQPLIIGAGALLGASMGTDAAHRRAASSYYVTERRCEIDYELRDKSEVVGYRVSYRYGDTIYQTRMDRHPGDTVRLQVDVRPVE